MSNLDEIKEAGYRKRHLIELGYSTNMLSLASSKMDPWNLHTFSDQGVEVNKLSLCTIKNSSSLKDILFFALEQTTLNLEEVCLVFIRFFGEFFEKVGKNIKTFWETYRCKEKNGQSNNFEMI